MFWKHLIKKINKHNISNIKPIHITTNDDIHDMDFNIILLIDVLHLIEDKIRLIRDLTNKLSIDGRLIIKYKFISDEQITDIFKKADVSNFHKMGKGFYIVKNI